MPKGDRSCRPHHRRPRRPSLCVPSKWNNT
jgi:hypothetical protein